jgi:hypothetical protein
MQQRPQFQDRSAGSGQQGGSRQVQPQQRSGRRNG